MESVNARPSIVNAPSEIRTRNGANDRDKLGETARFTSETRFRLPVGAAMRCSFFYVPRHSVPTSATKTCFTWLSP